MSYAYFKSVFLVFHFFRFMLYLDASDLAYLRKKHEKYGIKSSAAQVGLLLWVTSQAGSLLSSTYKKLDFLRRASGVKKARFLNFGSMITDLRN